MALSVYEVLPLLPRCQFRVTSAVCVPDGSRRNQLLVGCNDGSVKVFDVIGGTDPQLRASNVVSKFVPGKKPVQHLACVQRWGVVLSMSPAGVSYHTLPGLKSGGVVWKTKNCSAFCYAVDANLLIVSARKKIRIHKWDLTSRKFVHHKDHVTSEEALSLAWTGNNTLIVGYLHQYMVMNADTGDARRIFDTRHTMASPGFEPRCILMGQPLSSRVRSRTSSSAHMFMPDEDDDGDSMGGGSMSSDGRVSTEVLLVKGSKTGAQGIFVNPRGRPTRTVGYCVQWPSMPADVAAAVDFPYVVSALPRSVEVHNTLTMSSAQSIPLPGAVCVLGFQAAASSGGGGHGSGAGAGAGAGAGGGGGASAGPEHLLVVCPNDLFVLRMVPLVMQVADLVSRRPPEFEEALALCEHCRGDGIRDEKIREIRADYGYELFAQGEFHGALTQFWWAEEPVKRVLGLFPKLLPAGLDLSNVQAGYPVSMPSLAGPALAEALQALIPYLEKQRERLLSAPAGSNDEDSGSEDDTGAAPRGLGRSSTVVLPSAVLVDTVLVTAYLKRAGRVTYATSDSDGETLLDHDFDIDTLDGVGGGARERRFRSSGGGSRSHRSSQSVATDESDSGMERDGLGSTHGSGTGHGAGNEKSRANRALARLLSSPNKCYVEECEQQLRQHRKWVELPLLYKGKGLHRKALELLATRLENANTAGRRRKRLAALVEYLKFLGDSHRHLVFEFVKPLLTQRTVAIDGDHGNSYASGLGDDFTLSATVKAGLSVLKSTPPGNEQPLDPDAVLDFVKTGGVASSGLVVDSAVLGTSPSPFGGSLGSAGAGTSSVGGGAGNGRRLSWDPAVLAVEYLEYLIYERNDVVVSHHNELVLQYITVIEPLLERARRLRARRAAAARERRRARARRSSKPRAGGGRRFSAADRGRQSSGERDDPFGAGALDMDADIQVEVSEVGTDGDAGSSTDDERGRGEGKGAEGGRFESGGDGDGTRGGAPRLHRTPSRGTTLSAGAGATTPRLRNRARAGSEAGELGGYRRRLLSFLESSQLYTPSTLLSNFPTHDLFEERAVLLGRLGQHEAALRVYAHQLKDDRMAAEYCDKVYRSGDREGKDVYLTLLQAYVTPPRQSSTGLRGRTGTLSSGPGDNRYSSEVDTGDDEWGSSGSLGARAARNDAAAARAHADLVERTAAVMQILAVNVARVDTTRVIELLPPFVPLAAVRPLLEGVIRHRSDTLRQLQVSKQLCRLQRLNTEAELNRQRARATKIGVSRVCPVCQRRIGKAAFALYPNGVVVHFGCCKDKHVCPVSGTRFADAIDVVGSRLRDHDSSPTEGRRRRRSSLSALWTRLRAHSGTANTPPSSRAAHQSPTSARGTMRR